MCELCRAEEAVIFHSEQWLGERCWADRLGF
jgi:hypothetical protein